MINLNIKPALFAGLFLLLSFNGFSQQEYVISGTLVNSANQEVLPYSSAILLNAIDSTTVKGVVADENGTFLLQVTPNEYLLKLQYIGFQDKFLIIDKDQTEALYLGKIGLTLNAEELEAVEVVGQKSEISYQLDKKVFTVGTDLTAVGTNAVDVLGNVPSVSTDIDGNVSLRGSEGVTIMINGKPSGLTGLGTTNALKNLPANLIEKIEVITNPSARYDAQGQVGIINIVLKKQRKAGFNGSIDANVGYPESYGGAVNLNYRKNKVNLFTSLGGRKRISPGEGYTFYDYYTPNNGIYFSSNSRDAERNSLGFNGRFGVEYFIDDRHSLTGSFGYSMGDDNNDTDIIYSNYDASRSVFHQTLRTDDEKEDEEDLQYNINYVFDINKKKGKKLTADVRYEKTSETEGSDYVEQTIFGDVIPTVDERSLNDESQGEYLFQIDYVNPISKTNKFEVGAKSTLRDIDTDFTVERLIGGNYEVLPNLKNQFNYEEDIYAIYGQYADEIGRFGYQVGLRGEYTDILTELKETNEVNARDYLNLFPSAFLTYKTESDNSVQLSYSRRFRRPGFWHLNPFLTFSDSRRRFSGNPNLDPEFTNSFELGYLKNWEKTTLNSAVYYRHTTDAITRVEQAVVADTVNIVPINLSTRNSSGIEFTLNSDVAKWWTVDGNFNLFYFEEDGNYLGTNYSADGTSFMSRLTNRFRFANDISGQVRSFYMAPTNTTQGKRKGVFVADIGASKEVLKKKGTLTFNVRDVANSRKRRMETFTDNFYSETEFQWRARSFNLGFNYRINQNGRKRRGGAGQGGGDYDDGGGMM